MGVEKGFDKLLFGMGVTPNPDPAQGEWLLPVADAFKNSIQSHEYIAKEKKMAPTSS